MLHHQLDAGGAAEGVGFQAIDEPNPPAIGCRRVVRAPEGIFVTSENGIAAECYAPEHSNIRGLRDYAKRTGAEVVLNGNTLENAIDQYISMLVEKTIAGPSARNPDFPNVAPSSEMVSHPLSPGLSPTFHLGELSFGTPDRS